MNRLSDRGHCFSFICTEVDIKKALQLKPAFQEKTALNTHSKSMLMQSSSGHYKLEFCGTQ